MKNFKTLNLLLIFLILFNVTGCFESDAENAAEDVVEKTEEIGEDAADKVEDASEEVGDSVEDAVN